MEFLEEHYETIRDELRAALRDPLLEQKGNAIWVAAARDDAEGYGPDWRTLVLQDRCEWEPSNVKLFPKTVDLVKRAATPSVEVFFAKQAPQTGIKPHTDFTNFIMTAHLGLDVPPKPESWMKVGEETQYWENGKGMCADTSFIHSTYNESTTMDRFVLIVRFWHPELTKHERNGVRFLFDAFEDLSPEGLRQAQDNARARTKADAEAAKKSDAATESDAAAAAEPAAEAPDSRRPGGRKKNKRNKRKAASGSGDGLGLLAKGMK
jgi:aspartate beta-hydroxylase